MEWSFEPGVLAWLLVAEALYVRAVRRLRRRGANVPGRQVACWHGGIALQAAALLSPIGAYADDLLAAHMVEHVLLADLGAPLLLAGLRTPVLQHFLPLPVLVAFARRRRLRRGLATLRRPVVALGVYVVVLYAWHVSALFEAATAIAPLHAVQHATFVATGILVWWSLLEPQRRRATGGLWKIPHILSARMAAMLIGMAFVVTRTPLYTGVYSAGDRPLGFSALGDQQTAGGIMISVDLVIMVAALAYFFWQASEEDTRAARPPVPSGRPAPPAARHGSAATRP